MGLTNQNGVSLSYLKDKTQFIENLIKDAEGEKLELDYWQQGWVADDSPYKIANKSRQTGFSFAESLNGLANSHLTVGIDQYFVSISLVESKTKIQYVNQAYDSLPSRFKLRKIISTRTEIVFEDNQGRQHTIQALTSKEPRGMHGNITLDEVAHYRNSRAIFAAASAVGIRKNYRLSLGSTPKGKRGVHWEIASNHKGKYSHFRLYEIPWWYSSGLCKDVKGAVKLAPHMSTKERVEIFGTEKLQHAFESLTIEEFVQEYECGFVDDIGAYMPYELVQSCWEEDYSDDPTDEGVSMLFNKFEGVNETEPPPEFWAWLRANKRGMIEMGYDVARSGDFSALVAVDTVRNVSEVRAIVTLKNASFGLQETMIDQAIRTVKPIAFRYDNTALGMATGESLAARWGSLFERINFNNTVKAEMATGLKRMFEKKTTRIPAWQTLTDNIRSIQKGLTDKNKLITFEADATEHHGDIYWAYALAVYRDGKEISEPEVVMRGTRLTMKDAPI